MTEQLDGQMNLFDLVSPFGKTFPEPSAVTKEKISERCSKPFPMSGAVNQDGEEVPTKSSRKPIKDMLFLDLRGGGGSLLGASWELVTALPGVSMTLNFGEFPSDERESTLSQILDLSAPEKYYLSPRAAAGILRRALKRGKELPDMLKDALEEVCRGYSDS